MGKLETKRNIDYILLARMLSLRMTAGYITILLLVRLNSAAYTCNGITTTKLVKGLNGICYAPFSDTCNWNTCFQRCRTNVISGTGGSHTDGQLAIMDSDAIADFMYTEVQTPMNWQTKHIYIGGKQYDQVIEPDGHYVWYGPRTGETWEFPRLATGGTAGLLPWTVNQPNNALSNGERQDCAAAYRRGFHDIWCSKTYTYICQYGPPVLCSATSCPNGGECRHLDPHYKSFGCFHFENTPATAEQAAKNCRDGTHGFQGELAVMNSNAVRSIMRDFVGPSTTCFHAGGKQSDQNDEATGGNWVWENPCGMKTPFSAFDFWGASQPANLVATPYEMTVVQCQDGLHTASNTDTAVYVCRIDTAPGFCCTKPTSMAPNTNVVSYISDADVGGIVNTATHAASGATMNVACDAGYVLSYDWTKSADTVQCVTEQTWEQDPAVFTCQKVYTCKGVKTVQPASELNGACYVVFPNDTDWSSAQTICESNTLVGIDSTGQHQNGQLATVDSSSIAIHISGLLDTANWLNKWLHIGGKQISKDVEPHGLFQWHSSQTNEAFELPLNAASHGSLPWMGSQPDNGGNSEDCILFRASTATNGGLNDISCSAVTPFICQYGPTPLCSVSSCPNGGVCRHLDPHYKTFGCFHFENTPETAEQAASKCRDNSLGFIGELVLMDSLGVKSIMRDFVPSSTNCIHTGGKQKDQNNEAAGGNWEWQNPCGIKKAFTLIDEWAAGQPASLAATTHEMTALHCHDGLHTASNTDTAAYVCRIDTAPAPCCTKLKTPGANINNVAYTNDADPNGRALTATHASSSATMQITCDTNHVLNYDWSKTTDTLTCASEQAWSRDPLPIECLKVYTCNSVKTVQPATELDGACYVAYPNASDFDTSKGLCESTVLKGIDNNGKHEKGQLAIVDTTMALDTIAGNLLIESATYSSSQVFIGAKQYDKTHEPEGHFQWHGSQTNELWELHPNFAAQTSISYAPSDTGGTEDCLSVRATTAVDGKLNDITCSTTAPFICQYGPTPNCTASSCPDGGDCKHLDPHYKSFGCFKYVATSLTAEKAQMKCRDGSLGFVGELVLLDSWDVKSIVRGLVGTTVDCIHTGGTLDEHGWNWLNPCGMKTPFGQEDKWDTSEPAHSYVTTKTTTAMQCKNGMKSTDGTIAAPFICRIDTAPAPCCLKPPDDMEPHNATIVSFIDELDAKMNESTHGPVETKMNVKCLDDHYLDPEEEMIETEMTFTCQSEQTWAPDLSEMKCQPPPPYNCKVEGDQAGRAIGMGSFTISSIYLIVALASLLIVFLIVRDFSICRFYHIIQEGSLLITQLIILPARSGTLLDLNAFCFSSDFVAPQLSSGWCKVIAVTLHYLFLVFFLALFFEALHNYTVFTNVTAYKPLLTRWQVPLVCMVLPIPFVAPCAIFFLDGYIHDNTCWLNFSSAENVYIELVPMCLLFAVTIIISEATGMIEYPKHIAANEPARFSALANSKAGMIFPCVSLGLWLTGMLAVHYTDAALYSIASIFNISLASTMLFFHTAGSARARYLLKKAFCSCCKSCGVVIEKPV